MSIFDLVGGLAPPACTNEFIQPNRALKSDMAELPEHLFVAELLPSKFEEERENAAQIQSLLIVIDDVLKKDGWDGNPRRSTESRSRELLIYIDHLPPEELDLRAISGRVRDPQPPVAIEKLKIKLLKKIPQNELNERLTAARAIVDEGKGLGPDYQAVPSIDYIFSNQISRVMHRKIDIDTWRTCMMVQIALQKDAILQGRSGE